MTTFRKYGGVGFSDTQTTTRTRLATADVMNVAQRQGQQHTATSYGSHMDMAGNSMLSLSSLGFVDGSVQYTAATSTPVLWTTATDGAIVNINPSNVVHIIDCLSIGANLEFTSTATNSATISTRGDLCLAALGDVIVPGTVAANRILVSVNGDQMTNVVPMTPAHSVDEMFPVSYTFEGQSRLGLLVKYENDMGSAEERREKGEREEKGERDNSALVQSVAGREHVDYAGTVALLVQEVKRLKARLSTLELSNP